MSTSKWFWGALFLNYIYLQILDAIVTILVVQSGKGVEVNGIFNILTSKFSLYTAMGIKIFLATTVMYLIYRTNESYYREGTEVYFWGWKCKATSAVYTGLVAVNLIYYLIVLNGFLVLLYPSLAPLKSG